MKTIEKKIEKEIEKMMSGPYDPTRADADRIYQEYADNKGWLAGVLSDVYAWLYQQPYHCVYKGGDLYIRAEVFAEDPNGDILAYHYIYRNTELNIEVDSVIAFDAIEEDIVDSRIKKEGVSCAKSFVNDDIQTILEEREKEALH